MENAFDVVFYPTSVSNSLDTVKYPDAALDELFPDRSPEKRAAWHIAYVKAWFRIVGRYEPTLYGKARYARIWATLHAGGWVEGEPLHLTVRFYKPTPPGKAFNETDQLIKYGKIVKGKVTTYNEWHLYWDPSAVTEANTQSDCVTTWSA